MFPPYQRMNSDPGLACSPGSAAKNSQTCVEVRAWAKCVTAGRVEHATEGSINVAWRIAEENQD
jgi:hypothetical protein